ncbi:hypothetical protein BGX21_003489 [Mortierella sp. AD011]|nr:hypothetical protein BGX20_011387 [Mortierella sp. AD010]KAF9400801.1 hypothetical protein BGX21_003489 [Mortierella sp. AD011]
MVNLQWTPRLEKAFKKLQTKSRSSSVALSLNPLETRTLKEVDSILEKPNGPECVDVDLIKRVSALLLKYSSSASNNGGGECSKESVDSNDTSEDWVHVMIKGSSVYVPKPAPKERSPELDRIMEGIKAQLAEKEYQRMISSIDPNANGNLIASSIKQDLKEMKDIKAHMIGIVNVLYTGVAVFTAVFMISAHFTDDLGKRVLLAFLGFVLIVACEAYLYSRHTSDVTAAPRKKKEIMSKLPYDAVVTTKSSIKEKRS